MHGPQGAEFGSGVQGSALHDPPGAELGSRAQGSACHDPQGAELGSQSSGLLPPRSRWARTHPSSGRCFLPAHRSGTTGGEACLWEAVICEQSSPDLALCSLHTTVHRACNKRISGYGRCGKTTLSHWVAKRARMCLNALVVLVCKPLLVVVRGLVSFARAFGCHVRFVSTGWLTEHL